MTRSRSISRSWESCSTSWGYRGGPKLGILWELQGAGASPDPGKAAPHPGAPGEIPTREFCGNDPEQEHPQIPGTFPGDPLTSSSSSLESSSEDSSSFPPAPALPLGGSMAREGGAPPRGLWPETPPLWGPGRPLPALPGGIGGDFPAIPRLRAPPPPKLRWGSPGGSRGGSVMGGARQWGAPPGQGERSSAGEAGTGPWSPRGRVPGEGNGSAGFRCGEEGSVRAGCLDAGGRCRARCGARCRCGGSRAGPVPLAPGRGEAAAAGSYRRETEALGRKRKRRAGGRSRPPAPLTNGSGGTALSDSSRGGASGAGHRGRMGQWGGGGVA